MVNRGPRWIRRGLICHGIPRDCEVPEGFLGGKGPESMVIGRSSDAQPGIVLRATAASKKLAMPADPEGLKADRIHAIGDF